MSVVRASPGTARGARGAPLGYGVIGNTADSGSVVLGSSPGTPASVRPEIRGRLTSPVSLPRASNGPGDQKRDQKPLIDAVSRPRVSPRSDRVRPLPSATGPP